MSQFTLFSCRSPYPVLHDKSESLRIVMEELKQKQQEVETDTEEDSSRLMRPSKKKQN